MSFVGLRSGSAGKSGYGVVWCCVFRWGKAGSVGCVMVCCGNVGLGIVSLG